MQKLFGPDSLFYQVMATIGSLILINLLWLLCCLPVITIGVSTSAMYTLVRRLAKGEEENVFKAFFRGFSKDFKKATGLFLIILTAAAIILADWLIVQNLDSLFYSIALIPTVFFLLVATNIYPIFSQFENTVWNTLKNAVVFSMANLWRSIVVALLDGLPLLLFLYSWTMFLQYSIFWLVIGCALTAYLKTLLLKPVFERYIPQQEEEVK